MNCFINGKNEKKKCFLLKYTTTLLWNVIYFNKGAESVLYFWHSILFFFTQAFVHSCKYRMQILLPQQPIKCILSTRHLQADPQQSFPRRQLAEAPLVGCPHPPDGESLHGGGRRQEGLAQRRRLLRLRRLDDQGRLRPGTAAHLQVRGRWRKIEQIWLKVVALIEH